MWVYQYQPLLNGLLQKALVELCTQSLPWEGRLEIDGIFCVSGKDPSQQIVIKIHKALEKPEPKNQPKQGHRNHPAGNKKVLIEAGKIVSTSSAEKAKDSRKSPTKKSNLMPLNLSLPNLKSGASVTQNVPISLATSGVTSLSGIPKSLTVGNQSLRALLGAKAADGSLTSLTSASECGDDKQTGTILKQPQAVWLRKDGEELPFIKHEQDTESEAGSDKRVANDMMATVKEEPLDMESESSLDLDEETLPAINVTCKICSIIFENFQALQSHTLSTHKRYACRQCCNTFSLRCNLRRHERLHAGVKPHACSYCKKSFSRSADLKAHLRKHDSEKTPDWITCSKCPKSFRSAVNLRLHMYKVHKEKDCVYACDICEKVFHDPDEFQSHRDTHTASLVRGGRSHTDSACSTPVVNGSQDSMEEDGLSSDEGGTCSEDEINYREMDMLVNSQDARPKQVTAVMGESRTLDSPASADNGMSPYGTESAQGNDDEDLGLYFGSPLVIKEENDSNDADMKRSNRRKSKPNKVVSSQPVEVDDDTENLEPHSGQDPAGTSRNGKRDAPDDTPADSADNKRIRIQQEMLPTQGFCMADQSLEAIMKQVNENLYKNKDVLIAEEKEKENEKKGKSKSAKGKASRKAVAGHPLTSTPVVKKSGARLIEPKPPIVLLVSSNSAAGAPKIAIPTTPNTLRMNLVKQEASSWTVSPKTKSKKDANSSFSPIPHELFLKASKETDTKDYSCGQWGCGFACVGFQQFEEHTLSIHGRYPCKFCSQTFTGRNNRTRHIRYHMTGKQHQCTDCGKYFARPDSLKEHRFIHTKSYRDSNCCNCKIYFEKKATLLSHMKKCFSDDQLVTDKLSPDEIEKECSLKRDSSKDSSFSLRQELLNTSGSFKQEAIQPIAPAVALKEPSDIGVMKAEYLQKEKQKIMDVKNYLDNQMAEMENVLETAAGSPGAGDPAPEEDDVTVIDLDAKMAAVARGAVASLVTQHQSNESDLAGVGMVTESNQAGVGMVTESNQAGVGVFTESDQASVGMVTESNQAGVGMVTESNQARVGVFAESDQAGVGMVAESNQAGVGVFAESDQARVGMVTESNQAGVGMVAESDQAGVGVGMESDQAGVGVGTEDEQPQQPGYASSLISNIAIAVAEAKGSGAQTTDNNAMNQAVEPSDKENDEHVKNDVTAGQAEDVASIETHE